jgi:hypothetical protein
LISLVRPLSFRWDPLTRTAALGQLGLHAEAQKAGGELMALVPEFKRRGSSLIKRMVFSDEHTEKLREGLRKAGMETKGSI